MTTPEERRAEKARIKKENAERYAQEVPPLLAPLPENLSYNQLVMEHQKLRMKIMEMQQLVITGKLDFTVQQEWEGKIVAQIHAVEARVAAAQGRGHESVGKDKGPGF